MTTKRRPKGEGSIIKLPNGHYKMTITIGIGVDGKQKRKSATAKTKKELLAKVADIRLKSQVNNIQSKKPNIYFRDAAELFLQSLEKEEIAPSTFDTYKGNLRRLCNIIGHLKIRSISANTIETVLKNIKTKDNQPYTRASKRLMRITVGLCMGFLVSQGYLEHNVVKDTKGVTVKKTKVMLDLPTEKEMQFFLSEAKRLQQDKHYYEHMYELLLLFYATGMRSGEGFGLLRKYVSLVEVDIKGSKVTKGLIKVRSQTTLNIGFKMSLKTEASYRDIYVDKKVAEALLALPNESEWIFNYKGRRCTYAYLATKIRKFFTDIGYPNVTVYTFRHYQATTLLRHHVNIKQVSRRMGHSNIGTTGDMYAHFLKEEDAIASAVLSI